MSTLGRPGKMIQFRRRIQICDIDVTSALAGRKRVHLLPRSGRQGLEKPHLLRSLSGMYVPESWHHGHTNVSSRDCACHTLCERTPSEYIGVYMLAAA